LSENHGCPHILSPNGDFYIAGRRLPATFAGAIAKSVGTPAQLQCRRASGRGLFSHAARDRQSSFRQHGLARVNRLSLNIGHGAVVFVHACEERDRDIHQMGIPAFLGISLHSLLDGIALDAGLILPQLGPVVLLAVIVHKMPDSMSISSILLAAGWNRRKVAILNLLFSLTTPIGALLAFLFFRSLAPEHVVFAIGISAGTFLAIATADILPQVHRIEQRNPATLVFLLAGFTVSWLGKLVSS
jgi:zinc transporter ZupT